MVKRMNTAHRHTSTRRTRRSGAAAALTRIMLGATLLLAGAVAPAQKLDLSTAPLREGVELTIYNSEDLTLVRETRTLSFKPGLNRLQFAWANTLIDPTSVELRFPRQADALTLIDTSYPQDRPQMLYWNVESTVAGAVEVEISYFTSGLTWEADYLVIADQAEAQARIDSFVRVTNRSGEDYPNARVRLVVGTINLVEQIAALARVPVSAVRDLDRPTHDRLRKSAARQVMALNAAPAPASAVAMESAPVIVKQGLSEYFIYTVEGTETIPDGWSKRLRSFSAEAVPLEVLYRYRERQYGAQLVRLYRLRNDAESGLGETPLPDGTVRVFQENAAGGLGFAGRDQVRYVAIGDRLELNLGADPRVGFELRWLEAWRDNIWLQVGRAQVLRRAGERGHLVQHDARVVGWDAHRLYVQRIHNHTGRAIQVEVRRSFGGDVEFVADLDARRHDLRTIEYSTEVAPGARLELPYQVTERHGRNAEQDRVQLRRAAVAATPQRAGRG